MAEYMTQKVTKQIIEKVLNEKMHQEEQEPKDELDLDELLGVKVKNQEGIKTKFELETETEDWQDFFYRRNQLLRIFGEDEDLDQEDIIKLSKQKTKSIHSILIKPRKLQQLQKIRPQNRIRRNQRRPRK